MITKKPIENATYDNNFLYNCRDFLKSKNKMENFKQIKEACINLLLQQWKQKEYNCHIIFVAQIAERLAKKHNTDSERMYIAWLLHDIWRDQELPWEEHGITWGRITKQLLSKLNVNAHDTQCIIGCVVNHNNHISKKSLEEKIIMTADSASKILYHQAFMLMCKKDNYKDRAAWWIKYLNKWLKGIQFDDVYTQAYPIYNNYMSIYNEVLSEK